ISTRTLLLGRVDSNARRPRAARERRAFRSRRSWRASRDTAARRRQSSAGTYFLDLIGVQVVMDRVLHPAGQSANPERLAFLQRLRQVGNLQLVPGAHVVEIPHPQEA